MKSLEARKAYREKQKELEQTEREIGGLTKEQAAEEGGGTIATNESDAEDSALDVEETTEDDDDTEDEGLRQREQTLREAAKNAPAWPSSARSEEQSEEDEDEGEETEVMSAEDADDWVNDSVENIKANLGDLSDQDLSAIEEAEKRGKARVSVADAIAKEREARTSRGANWTPGKGGQ